MRLDPKLVHPSIFKATDGVIWSGKYGNGSVADMKAATEHQKVWFKEYGTGCVAYALGCAVALAATVSIAHDMVKPAKGLFILGMMAAMALVGGIAFLRNLRQITAPELGALLPILDLTEVQRAYAETVIALERSGRSRFEIEETMSALNALLDEEARLNQARETIGGSDAQVGREAMLQERQALAGKLDNARDDDAKKAFEQSIALLDERLANYGVDSQIERVDAHLELLRQAVLTTRDAAIHRAAVPALPELGTDSLRSAVASARAQSQETERALAELRAI